MSISIDDALRNNLITAETASILPRTCSCGSEVVFSDSLKRLVCNNPKCRCKVISRFKQFRDMMSIRISDADIELIIKELKLSTPYQLLMLGELDASDPSCVLNRVISDKNVFLQDIEKVKQSEYFIYDIVKMSCIQNIATIAFRLFNGFNSIDEAYEEIETSQVAFINERLGIYDQDSSIFSLQVYNDLISNKEELLFGGYQLKVKEYDKPRLNIAFADGTSPYINVSELVFHLNNNYSYIFNQVTTVNDSTDILVRNADSSNPKFRAARVLNDKHVAEVMEHEGLALETIGRKVPGKLKPIGNIIYVDSLENIIDKLDELEEKH